MRGVALIAMSFLAGCDAGKPQSPQGSTELITQDAIEDYNFAKQNMPEEVQSICGKAEGIKHAYASIRDTQNYQKWKAIAEQDCAKAEAAAAQDTVQGM